MNYGDTPDKGGWLDIFYPTKDTKILRYYSEFFNTVEMDSIFYEEFYSKMDKDLFFGMVKVTPQNFEFSIKVPERITHTKKLDIYLKSGLFFHLALDSKNVYITFFKFFINIKFYQLRRIMIKEVY